MATKGRNSYTVPTLLVNKKENKSLSYSKKIIRSLLIPRNIIFMCVCLCVCVGLSVCHSAAANNLKNDCRDLTENSGAMNVFLLHELMKSASFHMLSNHFSDRFQSNLQ